MEKKIKLIEENGENNDTKIFGNTMDGETVTYTIGWYCESIEKCKEEILGQNGLLPFSSKLISILPFFPN